MLDLWHAEPERQYLKEQVTEDFKFLATTHKRMMRGLRSRS